VALEQRGLRGALEELLAPIAGEAGARFSLEVRGNPCALAGGVELHLLRIAHQAVANALQHGAPREIRVLLEYGAASVTLEIRDNGRGFDPNAPAPRGHFGILGIRERANKIHAEFAAPRGHFGILGIRERANKIHAEFAIDSAPGAGTTVRVVAPIEPAAATNGHVA
jgi:signal transduction histidine kinase